DRAPTLAALRGNDRSYQGVARYLEANYELSRWVVAPPALEPEVLADWRAAIEAAVSSPNFIADARKLDIELHPMSGGELAGRIGEMLSDQEALRAELRSAFECSKSLSKGLPASATKVDDAPIALQTQRKTKKA
ncbi:MAG: hypothetical protein ACREEP_15015, partial [Dongiaceae bacterium]